MNDFLIKLSCILGLTALSITMSHCAGKYNGDEVYISEFMADNESAIPDHSGQFSDWLEIENSSDEPVNLAGFFLSDNPEELPKHKIGDIILNPGDHQLFWANGRTDSTSELNFKLSKNGGAILLTAPDGKTIVSQVEYGRQVADHSMTWLDGKWKFCGAPSPASANINEQLFTTLSEPLEIVFEHRGDDQLVRILQKLKGIIKYTTDGTSPFLETAQVYKNPFLLDSSLVIRAIQTGDDILTYGESQRAFIDASAHQLPILSLITDPKNLWSEEIGIFVKGNNKNCFQRSDEWIRPANIEYYKGGSPVFHRDAMFKIFGSGTRSQPKKSISILTRPEIENHFFHSVEADKIDGFVMRSCYANSYRYKNEVVSGVDKIMKSHTLMQEFYPAVLYVNGKYWGLFNLLERKNSSFIKNHYNVRPKVILNANYRMSFSIKGSKLAYDHFVDSLNQLNMKLSSTFDYINSEVDILSLSDHWIHELYTDKADYFNNRFWRTDSDTARWRFVSYDFDLGFARPQHLGSPFSDTMAAGVILIGRLLLNPEFKSIFVERLCDFMNYGYTESNIAEILLKTDNLTREEFLRDYDRWHEEMPSITGREDLQKNRILEYIAPRSEFLRESFASSLEFTDKVIIQNSQRDRGNVIVNGYEVKNTAIYFTGMKISIKAEGNPGFVFERWEDSTIRLSANDEFSFDQPILVSPVFVPE